MKTPRRKSAYEKKAYGASAFWIISVFPRDVKAFMDQKPKNWAMREGKPKNRACCQSEFADFKVLLERVVRRRGKERQKHILKLEEFFCDKVYEIMMRQRGYFTEVLKEKRELETRLRSVLNEKGFLEDQNFELRQKLAVKDVFLHNPSSSTESAS